MIQFKKGFSLCVLYLYCVFSLVSSDVVITTTGPVRGKLNRYRSTTYKSYEGIPFAESPVGDLRYRPPVPKRSWTHIYDATSPGCVCPQPEDFYSRSEMSENCLFLNLYVPITESVELLPVLFYVRGGYYTFGSGRPKPVNGPQLLLEKGFIVVTTNYRLGALGFLSLGTIEASGNAGLKDILLALKWVNSNIEAFGGNPKTICLSGQGAGASLVHYLLLTKQTTGLFQSAIIISGSAISYRASQRNPIANALKLAKVLRIEEKDNRCLLEKLKEADVFSIIDAQEYIIENDPRRAYSFIDLFSPTIEKPSSIAIITRNPLDIIRTEGLVQKVPVLTGFNDQEGLEIFAVLKTEPNAIDTLNENFELCIPPNIQYPHGAQIQKDLAIKIRKFYFNNSKISIFNVQNYINMISDTAYIYGIDYWIYLHKRHQFSSPVYYYNFNFDGQLNWGKLLVDITYPGACHCDELGYIFLTNVTERNLQCLDSKNQNFLDTLLYYFKNFTTYGNPTPATFGPLKWPEAGLYRDHRVLSAKSSNEYGPPLQERLEFWYREYERYYDFRRSNCA